MSLLPCRSSVVSLLKSSLTLTDICRVHAEISKRGLVNCSTCISSILIHVYAKSGSLNKAKDVFNKVLFLDHVCWTALMSAYAFHGRATDVVSCFETMQQQGHFFDPFTYACILKAFGAIRAIQRGQKLHSDVVKKGFMEEDAFLGSILVDMYAKWGKLEDAKHVLDMLEFRDIFSWTSLITGYVESGCAEEALNCFKQIQTDRVCPTIVTFVCVLNACGSSGALHCGRDLYIDIVRKGFDAETYIGNSLIDMYTKCGSLVDAQQVCDKLPAKDVISWTSMVLGYGQLGKVELAFSVFDRMISEGVKPDLLTFSAILNACSHAGLFDKAQLYFKRIRDVYNLVPTMEHYNSIIDLVTRTGDIRNAFLLIDHMPYHPGIVVWHSILRACQRLDCVDLARLAFEHAIRLDDQDAGSYVCMSNIYADAVMRNEVDILNIGFSEY